MKAILLILAGAAVSLVMAAGGRDLGPNPPEDEYDQFHRFVFFAVLEGCYEDGLIAEDIDLIIPPDEHGGRNMAVNFVYTCPLCHPAFEAFRLYGSRERIFGQKVTQYDTFGPGLDNETKAKLRGTAKERRDAIQSLVSRWVGQRADLLRLDKGERQALKDAIEQMKEEGLDALKRFQENAHGSYYEKIYGDWKTCPICEGAAGAMTGGE